MLHLCFILLAVSGVQRTCVSGGSYIPTTECYNGTAWQIIPRLAIPDDAVFLTAANLGGISCLFGGSSSNAVICTNWSSPWVSMASLPNTSYEASVIYGGGWIGVTTGLYSSDEPYLLRSSIPYNWVIGAPDPIAFNFNWSGIKMPVLGIRPAALNLNGTPCLAGGSVISGSTCLQSSQWTAGPNPTTSRFSCVHLLLAGQLCLAGGRKTSDAYSYLSSIECINPSESFQTASFVATSSHLPAVVYQAANVTLNGMSCYSGGSDASRTLSDVWCANVSQGDLNTVQWIAMPHLTTSRGGHSSWTLDDGTSTSAPTTSSPTSAPTTPSPTLSPTTFSPTTSPTTLSPTTYAPTLSPTTQAPTTSPTTFAPTSSPTTHAPTTSPTTLTPTVAPTTLSPTTSPTTLSPTTSPTTLSPTIAPTTLAPTTSPTTLAPTSSAPTTRGPTRRPTLHPTTRAPVKTLSPTITPTTISPTSFPTTHAPTTLAAALEGGGKLSAGAKVGIALGVIIFVLCVGLICRRRWEDTHGESFAKMKKGLSRMGDQRPLDPREAALNATILTCQRMLKDSLTQQTKLLVQAVLVGVEQDKQELADLQSSGLEMATITTTVRQSQSIKQYKIEEFTLVKFLSQGEGGTAELYKHKETSREVAIKTPHDVKDLEAEVKVWLTLGVHPNIARLIGIATADGRQRSIIMEYYSGGSLASQNQEISASELVRIAIGLARGLQHLHNHKVIHRDLAPRNILVAGDRRVAITDFGMSRQLDENNNYQMNSDAKLPWRTLAPELIAIEEGEKRVFTEKTDVWALGITLWELATKRNAYAEELEKDPIKMMRQKVSSGALSLDMKPIILKHADLASALIGCLQLEPALRPSAEQLRWLLKDKGAVDVKVDDGGLFGGNNNAEYA